MWCWALCKYLSMLSQSTLLFHKCSLDNQVRQLEKRVFSSCQKRYYRRNSPLHAAPWTQAYITHKMCFQNSAAGVKTKYTLPSCWENWAFKCSFFLWLIAIAGSIRSLFFPSPLCSLFIAPLTVTLPYFLLYYQCAILCVLQEIQCLQVFYLSTAHPCLLVILHCVRLMAWEMILCNSAHFYYTIHVYCIRVRLRGDVNVRLSAAGSGSYYEGMHH